MSCIQRNNTRTITFLTIYLCSRIGWPLPFLSSPFLFCFRMKKKVFFFVRNLVTFFKKYAFIIRAAWKRLAKNADPTWSVKRWWRRSLGTFKIKTQFFCYYNKAGGLLKWGRTQFVVTYDATQFLLPRFLDIKLNKAVALFSLISRNI